MKIGLFGEADTNISTITIFEQDKSISKKERMKGTKFGYIKVRSVRCKRYVSICVKNFRTLWDWTSLEIQLMFSLYMTGNLTAGLIFIHILHQFFIHTWLHHVWVTQDKYFIVLLLVTLHKGTSCKSSLKEVPL